MTEDRTTVVDFIAKSSSTDEWKMVLVEEGPWSEPIEDHLRRIQGRLYDCIDAAIDGQLAAKFPDSSGKRVVIQLDCYNVPKSELSDFFHAFSDGVFLTDNYKNALAESKFVQVINFELNFDSIH
jgi:hypothetical protein